LEYGSDKYEDLSRLFIYYNEREMEGTVKEDSGAMLRDGIKSLVSYGVCSEDDWYYDISKYCVKPSLYCYESAINHRISVYMRLESLDEMLQCLANNYPFVFGFSVYNVFESEETANTGILSMPRSQDRLLGGHAVLAVGYDKDSKMILVRNSWGSSWGLGGYFWMPFEYLTNRDLSDDFWTIRR
jgi:C1A family cysteine protease